MTLSIPSRAALVLLAGAFAAPLPLAAQTAAPAAQKSAPAAKKSDAKSDAKSSAKSTSDAKSESKSKSSAKSSSGTKSNSTQQAALPSGLSDAQPSLLGQYGEWGAYTATPGGRKICFAIAKPRSSSTTPSGRPRDPAFLFISSRPAENVRSEVSVIIGYPFKASSEATAEIGGNSFAMYTQNDGAWIKNVAEEGRMIDAMRKGSDVTIKGESGKGTKTSDTFSLKGLAQAIDRAAQECR